MNIGLYIRLSKEDESISESKSITNQKLYLRNYIKKLKYNNVYEYIDDGYTGTNFNRPAFNQLLKDIEDKKIDTVITKDSSRLGRNITWVTFYIEEFFPIKKVRYISVDDNYDSINQNSIESEMIMFKNLFNDYYCKDISRKIKSSLKIKKIEGKFTGWKAPYGYKRKKSDYHKLEIDNKVKTYVVDIFNLALEYTPSKIAQILNSKKIASPSKYIGKKESKWTTKTIKDILQNQVYIGNLIQGKRKKINYKINKCINVPKEEWIIKENNHKPIINKELFFKVQELLHKYINIKKYKNYKDELINIMYCKECNYKIGINNRKKQSYCVCSNYKKNHKEKRCTPHSMNYIKLKEKIKKEIDQDLEKLSINYKDDIYINLIQKIYLSENGEVEVYLNYSSHM